MAHQKLLSGCPGTKKRTLSLFCARFGKFLPFSAGDKPSLRPGYNVPPLIGPDSTYSRATFQVKLRYDLTKAGFLASAAASSSCFEITFFFYSCVVRICSSSFSRGGSHIYEKTSRMHCFRRNRPWVSFP